MAPLHFSVLCLLIAAFLPQAAVAYPRILFEQEPNDTLEQAQSFRGEARLVGAVSRVDVDKFWWALDDTESDRLWTIELEGSADGGVQVEFSWPADEDSDGGVMEFGAVAESAAATALLDLRTTSRRIVDERTRLIVPPGEHLIAVRADGGGSEYQLSLVAGSRISVRGSVDADGGDSIVVAPGRDWYFQLNVAEHAIPLETEGDRDVLWRVDLIGELGAPLQAVLEDAAGTPLVPMSGGAPLQHQWSATEVPAGSRLRVRRTDGEPIGRVGVRLSEDGRLPTADVVVAQAGASIEEAVRIALPGGHTTELSPGQRRFVAFSVPADHDTAWAIDVTAEADITLEVCLGEIDGREQICRPGPGHGVFDALQLDPGEYYLRVRPSRRASTATSVQIDLRAVPLPAADAATEPNDLREWASRLPADEAVRGYLADARSAWFELRVTGEPQLWRVEAEGGGLTHLGVHHDTQRQAFSSTRRGRRSSEAGPLTLEPLLLMPGRYLIRIDGEDSDYSIAARPVGEPAQGWEHEPNDDSRSANRLRLGQDMRGTLHSASDEDHFYFHLPGWNRLVLDLEPPAGAAFDVALYWRDERLMHASDLRSPERFSQFLPPGDYYVVVSGEGSRGAEYRVNVDLDSPWSETAGHSFAPSPTFATPIPRDGRVVSYPGSLGTRFQYFRFPVSDEPRTVSLVSSQRWIGIVDEHGEEIELAPGHESGRFDARLPGGTAWYLRLRANAQAEIDVSDPASRPTDDDGIALTLAIDETSAPPWLPASQRVPVRLTVANLGSTSRSTPLVGHVSHAGGRIEGLPDVLTLEPGAERSFDLVAHLPAELPDEGAVHLFVRAGDAVAQGRIELADDAAPREPVSVRAVPDALRGLTDLAWSALGAAFIDPESGERVEERFRGARVYAEFLIDGTAAGGSSIEWLEDLGEPLPPLRLAGDGGSIHALVFNQRSRHGPSQRWRNVAIAYGDSPDAFEHLVTVELQPGDGEQQFVLDAPVRARYLQIRPLSVWGVAGRTHGTGLLRVLGEPDDALASAHANLLDPSLGGHWIYTRPDISRLREFPHDRNAHRGVPIRDRRIAIVFGFLEHRAARVAEVRWTDDPARDGRPVSEVRVFTSVESPIGPWHDHGVWTLERDAHGTATFTVPEPRRARYLKLEVVEPERGEPRAQWSWNVPVRIEAYEADAIGSRQSVLGYWGLDGNDGPDGPREAEVATVTVDDSTSSPSAPWTLASSVTGRVAFPGDARSYHVRLEAPDNTLEFTLDASQRGRLRSMLIGPDGAEVPLSGGADGSGPARFSVTGLSPGDYRLDVVEPPRSIVFIWDGSGSIAAHQPAIYQALTRFAEGLRPGQEVANMMALGGPLLIRGWAESPAEVMRTLAAYDGRFSSSDSEPALRVASRALEQRDGERVIFLITDAELMGRDLAVWEDLERVRPRIFALEINHGTRVDTEENRWYQHLMLGWANVADGRYRYATGRTDLIRAFEDGMRQVRRPTRFSLSVERRYEDPPRPGQLHVTSGDEPVVSAGVVHLIFDASGSMLRRMEGGRRIEVARRIVREVLDARIPESVPIALRAFGHTEPHSCETALLVPPSPDNHAEVRAAVDRIQAINLARTPLAASLNAVLADLEGTDAERRLVVMLTDGEETCDGDVERAVEDLVEQGANVRLNIVGFHIDEIGLQTEFERFAELGGGEYFDSHDADALASALVNALAAEFRVLDAGGSVVAHGRVDGEALELEPGDYTLIVDAGDGTRQIAVAVESGQVRRIELSNESGE